MNERGITTPIAKILAHLTVIFTGLTEETWPMTRAMATAEAEEAANHIANINIPEGLLTDRTNSLLGEWFDDIRTIRDVLRDLPDQDTVLNADTITNGFDLRTAITRAWVICTALDYEMLGVNNSVAGTTP